MRVEAGERFLKLLLLGGGLVAAVCLQSASAQAKSFVGAAVDAGAGSARPAPVLLELFTSEGCSSCPPADALLKQLDGTKTNAGQMLIGLSEHVTYWNDLGWRDPYSADLYTARQSAYSDRFHLDGVYTPQLVINGSAQVVGSDRRGIERALGEEQQRGQTAHAALEIASVRRVPEGLVVTYTLSGLPRDSHAQMFAAVADDLDRSSVLRGENGGRTLTHAAVVRWLAEVGPAQSASGREITVRLPDAARKSATRQHLVLFAQEANFGPVLGVAEQPLAQP